jgi:peptidoglycan-associated lipoprotein
MNRVLLAVGAVVAFAACHPKFPTCREDSDCLEADNHGLQVHCLDGQCQECRTDAECAIGKKCESMRCVAGAASVIPTTPPAAETASNTGATTADTMCEFPRIHFDYNSSALTPQTMEALQQVVTCLLNRPKLHLLIEGDCDERGTEEYNLALGQRRATNVEKYLEGLGVQRNSTISYGKNKPVCTQNTEACFRENRRAEFDISRK